MGIFAYAMLIVGALVIAFAYRYIGRHASYEWIVSAIGAFLGGWIMSAFIAPLGSWDVAFDGLYVVSALIGGLVLGAIGAFAVRVLFPAPTTT